MHVLYVYTYPGVLTYIVELNLISIHSVVWNEHVGYNSCSIMYAYMSFSELFLTIKIAGWQEKKKNWTIMEENNF